MKSILAEYLSGTSRKSHINIDFLLLVRLEFFS